MPYGILSHFLAKAHYLYRLWSVNKHQIFPPVEKPTRFMIQRVSMSMPCTIALRISSQYHKHLAKQIGLCV